MSDDTKLRLARIERAIRLILSGMGAADVHFEEARELLSPETKTEYQELVRIAHAAGRLLTQLDASSDQITTKKYADALRSELSVWGWVG